MASNYERPGIHRASLTATWLVTAASIVLGCIPSAPAGDVGHPESVITIRGLLIDLDADKGLTVEDGNKVAVWENQVSDSPVRRFVKRDEGRATPGSGRPVLRRSIAALDGHNSLAFRESELVNMDETAFAGLISGDGYTWLVVVSPYAQLAKNPEEIIPKLNAFLGNLKNGGHYEGFFAGFDYDNTAWAGSRNGITFGRIDSNNPMATGPRLERDKYYIVAGRMGAGLGWVPLEIFVDSPIAYNAQRFPVNPHARSSKLAIGQERDAINHPGLESFDGELARVLIYGRPLTDSELSTTINALKRTYFVGSAITRAASAR